VMPIVGPKYPWWILHLNYFIVFIFIGFTEYFCFVFFMNMRPETAQLAIQTALQAEVLQILVYEPGSIFAKTIILPFVLGTLAGTSFGRLANMAADIGLGAASGIGAVGFADRMMNQRREAAATKAQAAFRGLKGRRAASKVKAKQSDEAGGKEERRFKLKETSRLKGKQVSLFKMASEIAKQKASEEREQIRENLNKEIARRQLRPTRKRNLPVRKGMGERAGQSQRQPRGRVRRGHSNSIAPVDMMSGAGPEQLRRTPRGNAVRPAQFQRRAPGAGVPGPSLDATIPQAPMSGTVALSKALNKDQNLQRKTKSAKGRRKILKSQGEK